MSRTQAHRVPDASESEELRDLTVGQLLDEAAAEAPDAVALGYYAYEDLGINGEITFSELRERGRAVARALIAAGIERGDRVAVWATNLPEWVEFQMGAAYAGAILVPMNPLYKAPEVSYVLAKSGARICLLQPERKGLDLWSTLSGVSADLPDLESRVAIGDSPDGEGPGWSEWLSTGEGLSEDALEGRIAEVLPEHSSQIQFTSGTTGFPKGAELTHRGIVNNGRFVARRTGFERLGSHVNPMPYFHCGGCVMSTLGAISNRTAQLPIVTFEADRVIHTVDHAKSETISLVPTMMIAIDEEIARSGRGSLTSLEVVLTGGAPVPPDVEREWVRRFGVSFAISYGMTEASPVISLSSPDDPPVEQLETCGRPLPAVEVDVVQPGSEERVELGEEGEIRTRGWLVMRGYWGDPENTSQAVSDDGFLRTGDLGTLDEHGYVRVTGRAKDMIIRGGENIYPAEIEDQLRNLDEVVDAAVIGMPDERYGEEVVAFLRLTPDAAYDEESLRERLAGRIARFKVPRRIVVVEEFPTTPSGKVQKFRLRETIEAEIRN